jgi:hypothetical protein
MVLAASGSVGTISALGDDNSRIGSSPGAIGSSSVGSSMVGKVVGAIF